MCWCSFSSSSWDIYSPWSEIATRFGERYRCLSTRCDSYWPAALLLLGAAGPTGWDLGSGGWDLGSGTARRGNGEQRKGGIGSQGLGLCVETVRVRVRVLPCLLVLVLVFVCFWCCLSAGLMSSVKGHPLDWPWTGPVSRLCARADGRGAMFSLASSAQTQIQEIREQVRCKVGLEPVAIWPPWLPAWGRRLSSAPGSLPPGRGRAGASSSRQGGRGLPQLPQLLHDRPGPTTRRDPIRPDTASASPAGLCHQLCDKAGPSTPDRLTGSEQRQLG